MDYCIRNELHPGDLGWILYQHGIIYASSLGYDITFEKEIAKSIVRFTEQYQQGLGGIWVAESPAGILGTVAVHIVGNDEAEIRWIMVLPAQQGKGIGSRLLQAALDYCRSREFQSVHCRNVAVNSPGIPLYERSGFYVHAEEDVHKWGKQWRSRHYILRL